MYRIHTPPDDINQIRISNEIARQLQSWLDETDEVCGGIYGHYESTKLIVSLVMKCNNHLPASNSFSISISDLYKHKLSDSISLVGIFHTHPNGAPCLSWQDRVTFEKMRWIWLVVGRGFNSKTEFRCFVKLKHAERELEIR